MREREEQLHHLNEGLAHRIAELEAAQRTLKEARRATLNLLDDVRDSEATLRASEERLRAVTSIVPDLLWSSEPAGSTTWYNQRWLDYTGQTFDQAIARGWVAAIHPEERVRSVRRYREAVVAGDSLQQETRIRNAAGDYRWFLVRAEPLCDAERGVVRMYDHAGDRPWRGDSTRSFAAHLQPVYPGASVAMTWPFDSALTRVTIAPCWSR